MLTERLAKLVLETREIPDAAVSAAKDAFVDTLGVALAGSLEECAEIAQRWVQQQGSASVAPIWGTHVKSSALDAAFANGIASHALDFDDSLPTLRGHPSATLVPAILATGEMSAISGKAALEAFVIGVEVAGILGKAVGTGHYLRGWHTTATIGLMAATAAVARLLNLNSLQLQCAWGIAASETSGLVGNFGTMTKPFHAGHAARSALVAATLARSGFTANSAIFEGKHSFFDTYAGDDGEKLESLLPHFASSWQILSPSIYVKRWPCCYCNHRPVGGLFRLVSKHQIKVDEIKLIRIGFLPGSDEALVSEDPHTGLEGKFSIEYCAAATLLDGKLGLDSFTDAMVQRPEIRVLMKKVRRERIEAEGVYSGVVGYSDVSVETTRGNFDMRVEETPGSPKWPMTATDRSEKFLDCAARVLGSPAAKSLLGILDAMAAQSDLRAVSRLTSPDAATSARKTGTQALEEAGQP